MPSAIVARSSTSVRDVLASMAIASGHGATCSCMVSCVPVSASDTSPRRSVSRWWPPPPGATRPAWVSAATVAATCRWRRSFQDASNTTDSPCTSCSRSRSSSSASVAVVTWRVRPPGPAGSRWVSSNRAARSTRPSRSRSMARKATSSSTSPVRQRSAKSRQSRIAGPSSVQKMSSAVGSPCPSRTMPRAIRPPDACA